MFHKFITRLILLLLVVFVQGQELIQPGPPDSCFKTTSIHRIDRYHKDTPSPQGREFPECQSWKESSCCTLALTKIISRSKTQAIYSFSKDLCGPISPRCADYLVVHKNLIVHLATLPFHYFKHKIFVPAYDSNNTS